MKKTTCIAGLVITAIFALALSAQAHCGRCGEGDEDKGPEVGKAAPQFELKTADDKVVKLSDFKGQIVVLHFQSCGCPWETAYQPTLEKISQQYAFDAEKVDEHGNKVRRVQFIGINSNKNESYEDINKRVEEFTITYPILKDPGNKVADAYHAETTPHIFIIDEEQVLRYKGGIEKAPVEPGEVTKSEEQYLEPALQALLKGETPPFTDTVSKGCSIKREKHE